MGDTTSSQLLIVGVGLLIGIVITLGTWNVIANLKENTLEQVVARDLGLALSTIVGAPGDIDIRYTPRSDNLRISIHQTIITVTGSGESTYRYLRLGGVETESALLINQLSVPIRKQGNLLFFEEITTGCDFLYTTNRLPIIYTRLEGNLTNTKKELDEFFKSDDRLITFTPPGTKFFVFEVKRGDTNIVEFYGGDELLWYRKFACNLFEEGENFEFIQRPEQKVIITLTEDDPTPIINSIQRMLS